MACKAEVTQPAAGCLWPSPGSGLRARSCRHDLGRGVPPTQQKESGLSLWSLCRLWGRHVALPETPEPAWLRVEIKEGPPHCIRWAFMYNKHFTQDVNKLHRHPERNVNYFQFRIKETGCPWRTMEHKVSTGLEMFGVPSPHPRTLPPPLPAPGQ